MSTHAVVVGSGIAGLTVALHALEQGCRVTLVTKDVLEHANTRFAQGGIAGVMFDDDHVADHVRDTLTAGAGLADPAAVQVLVEEGPARIRELVDLGVAFDRASDGAFVKGLEAAHSYPRILHSGGDATGTAIEKALVARLRASHVRVIEHAFLIDLRLTDGRVSGVELLVGDGPDAEGLRQTLDADAVVLATGGAGELYAHSTNPEVATADGIAAAIRAGAAVKDLEFVQFHPTIIATGDAFLVSEAVRGEGATLIDENGRRFAFDSHPDGELAPRDVVARAIAAQMEAQDGRPVFLDATHLHSADADERAAFLAARFPTIDRAVRDRGCDWARDPIPVTPAAHYLMGGVATDLHGRTSVPGLYAVGEVARTGVHGANRLASNSLLEGAVFGARAGDVIAADALSTAWPVAPRADSAPAFGAHPRQNAGAHADDARFAAAELADAEPVDPHQPDLHPRQNAGAGAPNPHFAAAERADPHQPDLHPRQNVGAGAPNSHFTAAELAHAEPADLHPQQNAGAGAPDPHFAATEPADPQHAQEADAARAAALYTRPALQKLLWEHAGLVRDEDGLAYAASVIATWGAQPRTPRTERELEDENLLLVAAHLVAAARARRESVGAHFRRDAARSLSAGGAASAVLGVETRAPEKAIAC